MPPDAAREITVPGTELRLPGTSFRLLSVDICHHRTALRQENGQPTGVHVHLHLRYIVALPRRCPVTSERHRLIGEDTVSSGEGRVIPERSGRARQIRPGMGL